MFVCEFKMTFILRRLLVFLLLLYFLVDIKKNSMDIQPNAPRL